MNPALVIDHPSGYLALDARNRRFGLAGVPGFIAYRAEGRHLVVLGGVHALPWSEDELLDAFLDHAAAGGRRVLAVQVRERQVKLFRDRGFTVNQLGTSFGLRLRGFTLAGSARMQLRNKLGRARRAGVRVVEVGRDVPRDRAIFAGLRAISDAWLACKGGRELDFMVGELGEPDETARRIFLALDAAGGALGFITYVPVWGSAPGYLHDLTRRRPEAPPGVMELLNATAVERMRAEGVRFLHFGFTPFIVDPAEGDAGSRIAAWAVRALGRWGGAIYPARSQARYKEKWGPDLVEREYLAARPLGLRAVLDLLRVTRTL